MESSDVGIATPREGMRAMRGRLGAVERALSEMQARMQEKDVEHGRMSAALEDLRGLAAAEIKAIESEVRQEVETAVEGAKAAAQPELHLLYEDIYSDQSKEFFIRGCDNTVSHGAYGTTK